MSFSSLAPSAGSNKPKVASETIAYCTKCRMDLNHTIVAMAGDRIVRVHCRTCKTEHAYKSPKGLTTPAPKDTPVAREKKAAKKAESRDEAVPVEAEWTKMMNASRSQPAKAYSAKTPFLVGDRIQHSMFGEGVVNKLVYPNKIEVVFQMDVKTLIHGGTGGSN